VTLPPDGEGGTSRIVVALAPTDRVRIEKSWDPIGLAGTGSHKVVFDDIFVPDEQILDWPLGKPTAGYPTGIYVPGVWLIGTCAAATHIGVARHAIDEARQQLAGKTDRASGQPLMAKPNLLMTLEEAEGTVLAYRAGIETGLLRAWEAGLRGEPLDAELRVQLRIAAVTTTTECARVVRAVFDVSGAWAVHRSGVMQRLYRDAACLIHHISASRNGLETAGRVRASLDELTWRV
jgi:alkylation response protein AidB-like acyl-CoA dehydrogenase